MSSLQKCCSRNWMPPLSMSTDSILVDTGTLIRHITCETHYALDQLGNTILIGRLPGARLRHFALDDLSPEITHLLENTVKPRVPGPDNRGKLGGSSK